MQWVGEIHQHLDGLFQNTSVLQELRRSPQGGEVNMRINLTGSESRDCRDSPTGIHSSHDEVFKPVEMLSNHVPLTV